MADALLEVRDLRTYFDTDRGLFKAVDGVSFKVDRGRTVGLVGESGCGKSVTSLSVMGLVADTGRVEGEGVIFEGRDLLTLSKEERRLLRGQKLSMIFQEPMTSLNPVHTIGQQIVEGLRAHTDLSPQEARKRGDRDARHRPHSVRRRALRRLSASDVGRHAAARDDRHGAWPAIRRC